MTDEKVTKTRKGRRKGKSFSLEDARKAHRLYRQEELSGEELAAVMKRPRTTCLEMVKWFEAEVLPKEMAPVPSTESGPNDIPIAGAGTNTSVHHADQQAEVLA